MPEINLPTAGKQDTILANTNAINSNVTSVNTNVNANKSTLATVNANLGTPTSGASSSTGANAHAKLNYINSMLGTINNNLNAGSKHAGSYNSIGGVNAEQEYTTTALSVSGKGVLRFLSTDSSSARYLVFVDGQKLPYVIGMNTGFTAPLPFNSSLVIKANGYQSPYMRALYDIF